MENLKEQFEQVKQNIEEQMQNRQPVIDEQNRVVINMTVKNDDDFLSVYSENDTPVISQSVADFLENKVQSLKPSQQLTLRIKSNCVDDEEKKVYPLAIKEYYTEKYLATQNEIKRLNVIALLLAIFGVIVLGFALYVDSVIHSVIWAEVIDIVAWVLLWEAVDISIFRNRENRVTKQRCIALASANVEFYDL